MTVRTKVNTVGPVEVIKVEAELLDTPLQYDLDCTECGWGFFSASVQDIAEMHAQAHLDRNHELYDKYDDVQELP